LTYSAYGVATRHPIADFNRDGFTDFFDELAYDDCFTGSGCPSGQTADLNLDGVADMFDYDEWDLSYAEQVNTARGVLSQNDASAAVNRLGYAGYWFEPATQQYLVRHREYDPNVGTWDERDPMGYHDGSDLYMYVRDNPVTGRDPMGLRREKGGCGASGCNSPSQGFSNAGRVLQPAGVAPFPPAEWFSFCTRCVQEAEQDAAVMLARFFLDLAGCPANGVPVLCEGHPFQSLPNECARGSVGGYSSCSPRGHPEVTICAPRPNASEPDCRRIVEAVRHELYHALRCCESGQHDGSCETCLCEELGAYYYQGACEPGSVFQPQGGESRSECLARLACRSCASTRNCSLSIDECRAVAIARIVGCTRGSR
jgi:RHS repeat-associated protein